MAYPWDSVIQYMYGELEVSLKSVSKLPKILIIIDYTEVILHIYRSEQNIYVVRITWQNIRVVR